MNSRNFEQAFNAVFHDAEAFKDFCSIDMSKEIEEFSIDNRTVFKTSDKLKRYLRFIDRVIFRYLSKNEEVVHSYIKSKSPLTAVRSHEGSNNFFMTDIKDFFLHIGPDDVRNILIRDANLFPISDFEEYIPLLVKLTTWKSTIPIGFATSPKLSNAFLKDFDNVFHEYCISKDLKYTRYSDDIIVSCNNPDSFECLEVDIQNLLQNNAAQTMVLNTKKTKKTHIGNKVKILGLVIMPNGRITIDSKYKKTIETLLHFYTSDKEKYDHYLKGNKNLKSENKEHSVFGLLHYAQSVDPLYLQKLQMKYGAYALSSLMEDKWGG